jgi:hypothetical protein
MNRFLLIGLIFTAVFFSGCKRNKIAKSAEPNDMVGNLAIQEINFNYFSSKAKIDFNDGESNLGFTANIRMKKDSIIWLSASPALGIEAARVAITKDSVRIINRLNNTYQAYSLDYIRSNFNVELSLSNLQNVLLGNLVVPKGKGDRLGEEQDAAHSTLEQDNSKFRVRNFINKESHKVTRLIISETNTTNEVNVQYSDFAPLADFLFAYKNDIRANVIKEGKARNINIIIEHNKTEISDTPLNFAFNVPRKYENR